MHSTQRRLMIRIMSQHTFPYASRPSIWSGPPNGPVFVMVALVSRRLAAARVFTRLVASRVLEQTEC